MKYAINLFPHSQNTLSKRVSYFAIHYLRYVLVLTQLVVVIAFFYRFTVDQQIQDEKERLSQKQAIIKATEPIRQDLDKKQKSILMIKEVLAIQDTWADRFDYINSIFPKGVRIDSLNFDTTTIIITGSSENHKLIQQLYQKLQLDRRFKAVSLISLSKNKVGTGYDFVMQLSHFIAK